MQRGRRARSQLTRCFHRRTALGFVFCEVFCEAPSLQASKPISALGRKTGDTRALLPRFVDEPAEVTHFTPAISRV